MYRNVQKFIEIQCPTTVQHWVAKHSKTPSKLKGRLQWTSNPLCRDHFLRLHWRCPKFFQAHLVEDLFLTSSAWTLTPTCSTGTRNTYTQGISLDMSQGKYFLKRSKRKKTFWFRIGKFEQVLCPLLARGQTILLSFWTCYSSLNCMPQRLR
jgi:hypothetical protein